MSSKFCFLIKNIKNKKKKTLHILLFFPIDDGSEDKKKLTK